MTEREALKLALEALEYRGVGSWRKKQPAITAIKEALAQPEHGWTPERVAGMARLKDAQDKRLAQPSVSVEQEPVYWQWRRKNQPWSLEYVFNSEVKVTTEDSERRALYTTPPQRKPLTDEEIRKANHHMVDGAYDYSFKQGVKWAEYKHGIKGEA